MNERARDLKRSGTRRKHFIIFSGAKHIPTQIRSSSCVTLKWWRYSGKNSTSTNAVVRLLYGQYTVRQYLRLDPSICATKGRCTRTYFRDSMNIYELFPLEEFSLNQRGVQKKMKAISAMRNPMGYHCAVGIRP